MSLSIIDNLRHTTNCKELPNADQMKSTETRDVTRDVTRDDGEFELSINYVTVVGDLIDVIRSLEFTLHGHTSGNPCLCKMFRVSKSLILRNRIVIFEQNYNLKL